MKKRGKAKEGVSEGELAQAFATQTYEIEMLQQRVVSLHDEKEQLKREKADLEIAYSQQRKLCEDMQHEFGVIMNNVANEREALAEKYKLLRKALAAERKRRKEVEKALASFEESVEEERKEIYERVRIKFQGVLREKKEVRVKLERATAELKAANEQNRFLRAIIRKDGVRGLSDLPHLTGEDSSVDSSHERDGSLSLSSSPQQEERKEKEKTTQATIEENKPTEQVLVSVSEPKKATPTDSAIKPKNPEQSNPPLKQLLTPPSSSSSKTLHHHHHHPSEEGSSETICNRPTVRSFLTPLDQLPQIPDPLIGLVPKLDLSTTTTTTTTTPTTTTTATSPRLQIRKGDENVPPKSPTSKSRANDGGQETKPVSPRNPATTSHYVTLKNSKESINNINKEKNKDEDNINNNKDENNQEKNKDDNNKDNNNKDNNNNFPVGIVSGAALSARAISPSSAASRRLTPIGSRRSIRDEGDILYTLHRFVDDSLNAEEIKGGTLDRLIDKLTDAGQVDTSFVYTFIYTYMTFTTSDVLLEKLEKRFNLPIPEGLSERETEQLETHRKIVRVRVGNFMKVWLEKRLGDFLNDKVLCTQFSAMVQNTLVAAQMKLGPQLLKQLSHLLAFGEPKKILRGEQPPAVIAPKGETILDFDPTEVARQLTSMEFDLFVAIKPEECLSTVWMKRERTKYAPSIVNMIERFNIIVNWVALEVLCPQDDVKKRISVIEHLLKVAQKLLELNNFNSLQAILMGLQSAGVVRLKRTWRKFTQSCKKLYLSFATMLDLMSDAMDYKKYRTAILQATPPCIPCLSISLADLSAVEEGEDDFLDEGGKLINFEKRRKVYSIIRQLQQFQQAPYIFLTEPTIFKYFLGLDCHPTELELWEMSKRCEAATAKDEEEDEGEDGTGWIGIRLPTAIKRTKKTTSIIWSKRNSAKKDSRHN